MYPRNILIRKVRNFFSTSAPPSDCEARNFSSASSSKRSMRRYRAGEKSSSPGSGDTVMRSCEISRAKTQANPIASTRNPQVAAIRTTSTWVINPPFKITDNQQIAQSCHRRYDLVTDRSKTPLGCRTGQLARLQSKFVLDI